MAEQYVQRIVAQYLRMSTEHQKYSLDNQSEFIKNYALNHDMTIGYTYDDAGKSGLTIAGRPGLKRLLEDVINKEINIKAILVYDVSRFGRFQDIDEAAHYSYLIRKSGVKIIYCAEPFTDDNPEISMFGLNLLRYDAANYSRNLSQKVFDGQVNLIKRGYHQGGMAGYGLRRQLIDETHTPKETLCIGKRKSIQTDRVILIPGPVDEVKIVNEIFDMFIYQSKPELVIASELNRQDIKAENDLSWTRAKIHQILTNEKYIGNNIYNRTSFKLKKKYSKNPEDEWIRCNSAFIPIVSIEKFNLAKEIINARSKRLTNNELLDKLKNLLDKKGILSGLIIDEEELIPSSSIYRSRFGGLLRAYTLIGYEPSHDYSYLEINKSLRLKYSDITNDIINEIKKCKGWVSSSHEGHLLQINDELTLSISIARCQRLANGKLRWKIRFDNKLAPDISIAVRMDSTNCKIADYYIFPSIDEIYSTLSMREDNTYILDLSRFGSLDVFYNIVKRTTITAEV